jgi:hypothetical protein
LFRALLPLDNSNNINTNIHPLYPAVGPDDPPNVPGAVEMESVASMTRSPPAKLLLYQYRCRNDDDDDDKATARQALNAAEHRAIDHASFSLIRFSRDRARFPRPSALP